MQGLQHLQHMGKRPDVSPAQILPGIVDVDIPSVAELQGVFTVVDKALAHVEAAHGHADAHMAPFRLGRFSLGLEGIVVGLELHQKLRIGIGQIGDGC